MAVHRQATAWVASSFDSGEFQQQSCLCREGRRVNGVVTYPGNFGMRLSVCATLANSPNGGLPEFSVDAPRSQDQAKIGRTPRVPITNSALGGEIACVASSFDSGEFQQQSCLCREGRPVTEWGNNVLDSSMPRRVIRAVM